MALNQSITVCMFLSIYFLFRKFNNYILGLGEAHFGQQTKTAFLLITYKAFQYIGVNYGNHNADRPFAIAMRDADRPSAAGCKALTTVYS